MHDVQEEADQRGLPIQRVGVKDVLLPFTVRQADGQLQPVQASVTLTANLVAQKRGTHLSRFMRLLHERMTVPLDAAALRTLLAALMDRLEAQRADVVVGFPYFVRKPAPVTQIVSLLNYGCVMAAELDQHGQFRVVLGMDVPYTSLCPCSKEISDYGAHNQRGSLKVKVEVDSTATISFEELGNLLEAQSSCPVYPILKRPDEKFVTEYAFDHPKFVEDILRDTVLLLRQDPRIGWFEVEIENYESIHNHNAYAFHNEAWEPAGPVPPLVAKAVVLGSERR